MTPRLLVAMLAMVAGCRSSTGPQPLSSSPSAGPSSSAPDPLGNLERRLLFAPVRYPDGNWQPRGIKFEDAWFASADGTRLHGWYFPHERPRAIVLFCHGNAGNVALWADAARTLHDRASVAVLLFDYRGYGRSEGVPSEAGVLADARAARAWLAERAGIDQRQIVVMGRSLGGGVAVDLAAADGARALVLESTFTSVPDAGQHALPWLPVKWMARTQLNSLAKISQYRGPLLQSHGTADRLIPYTQGRQLFDAANEPKQFFAIPDGDHNDPQPATYYDMLAAFLDKLPP
jgi:uncharacterized protein